MGRPGRRLLLAILPVERADAVAGIFSGLWTARRSSVQPRLSGRAAVDRRRGDSARRRTDLQPRPARRPSVGGPAGSRSTPAAHESLVETLSGFGVVALALPPAAAPARNRFCFASSGGPPATCWWGRRKSPAAPSGVAGGPCSSMEASFCDVARPPRSFPPWRTSPEKPFDADALAQAWLDRLAPRLAVAWEPGGRSPEEDRRAAELADAATPRPWTERRGRCAGEIRNTKHEIRNKSKRNSNDRNAGQNVAASILSL